MKKQIMIIGAGGLAKVVLDAIIKQNLYQIKGFCVDGLLVGDKVFSSYTVLSDALLTDLEGDDSVFFVVAIGANIPRQKLFENALRKFSPAIVLHPSAVVGHSVEIKHGTVVLANAVLNPYTTVGKNVILAAGVLVDHDCEIGDHVHLSLGTIVASKSKVSDFFTSEIGSILKEFKFNRK